MTTPPPASFVARSTGPAAAVAHCPPLAPDVLGAVGNTPLVKLNKVAAHLRCNVYAKCEYLNAGGSVKVGRRSSRVHVATRFSRHVTACNSC